MMKKERFTSFTTTQSKTSSTGPRVFVVTALGSVSNAPMRREQLVFKIVESESEEAAQRTGREEAIRALTTLAKIVPPQGAAVLDFEVTVFEICAAVAPSDADSGQGRP